MLSYRSSCGASDISGMGISEMACAGLRRVPGVHPRVSIPTAVGPAVGRLERPVVKRCDALYIRRVVIAAGQRWIDCGSPDERWPPCLLRRSNDTARWAARRPTARAGGLNGNTRSRPPNARSSPTMRYWATARTGHRYRSTGAVTTAPSTCAANGTVLSRGEVSYFDVLRRVRLRGFLTTSALVISTPAIPASIISSNEDGSFAGGTGISPI